MQSPARLSRPRRLKGRAGIAAVAGMLAAVVPATAGGEVIETKEDRLKPGQHAFVKLADFTDKFFMPLAYDLDPSSLRGKPGLDWCHRKVDDNPNDADLTPDDEASCREWAIHVPEGGAWRLRVAADVPTEPGAILDLELWRPDGTLADHRRRFGGPFNAEVSEIGPMTGTWIVRVVPVEVGADGVSQVLARAKLEQEPTPGQHELLPNLRPETPHTGGDTGMVIPDNGRNGCELIDSTPTPAHDPTLRWRCLRFPFGYQNVGAGPLELRFASTPEADGRFKVQQVVFEGPDTTQSYQDNKQAFTRDAGTASYHEAHTHFHYDNILSARLFKVVESGVLEPFGAAAKRGNCAHDGILVGFRSFAGDVDGQADSGDACRTAGDDPEGMRIGLSPGWADLYVHELADNYVPFPENGQGGGEWVLRVRIDYVPGDADGLIDEVQETDNVGYTHFRFDETTDGATALERGRGTDPWDPNKVVITDYGQ